jgi:hypothetical protein
MDRQYEYFSARDSDYHGFLSHHPGECIDPLAKKRIIENLRRQIADGNGE